MRRAVESAKKGGQEEAPKSEPVQDADASG